MISRQKFDPGKLLASYKRSARGSWQIAGLVVLAIMVLFFVGMAVMATIQSVETYGPAAAFTASKAWYFAAGIGLIFFLGAWTVSGPRRPGILVHERALVLHGDDVRQVPWSMITGVVFREMNYRFGRIGYDASLLIDGEHPVDLTAWISGKGLVDVVVHIKARTYRRLDDQLRKQVQEGNWAEFGPLAISRSGIRVKGILHSWQDVKHLRIENGVLVIELHGSEKHTLGVDKLPNPELFMRIVSDFEFKDEA